MRTPNFRAMPKRCQEIYNDPPSPGHLAGVLNRKSDEISIVNGNDVVRNLTSQTAGNKVFVQGIDLNGGITQTFKVAVTVNCGSYAILQ